MGDRDYKVVYKSRVLDKDEPRPKIPTARDPYNVPYASESSDRRRYVASTSSLGDNSSTTETARSSTRTYPARESDRLRDGHVNATESTRVAPSMPENISTKRSVIVDQRRDEQRPRSSLGSESRLRHDRGTIDIDIDRSRSRGRDYYVDDRPRPHDSPYVIDTRQGDILDIIVPGRERDRGYDRDSRRPTYDRSHERDPYGRPLEDARSNRDTIVLDRDHPRYPPDEHRQSRPSARGRYDYEREDDWKLVESMRDTRVGDSTPTRETTGPRSRAPTQSSEDSYVMVSPSLVSQTQGPPPPSSSTAPARPRESSRARSALRRTDYSPPELQRRRSRSISFRDSEIERHEVGERRHERPGAEADICGPYLRRSEADYYFDDRSDVYAPSHSSDYRPRDREREADAFAATYRARDEPYGHQRDYDPRGAPRRDRSRRRRRDDDDTDDGATYYSENVTRKTSTRYR